MSGGVGKSEGLVFCNVIAHIHPSDSVSVRKRDTKSGSTSLAP